MSTGLFYVRLAFVERLREMASRRETINPIPCLPNLLLSPIFIAQGIKDNFRWRWDDTRGWAREDTDDFSPSTHPKALRLGLSPCVVIVNGTTFSVEVEKVKGWRSGVVMTRWMAASVRLAGFIAFFKAWLCLRKLTFFSRRKSRMTFWDFKDLLNSRGGKVYLRFDRD